MRKKILLIDIPSYKVKLPEYHRQLIQRRLRAQSLLVENRLNLKMHRPWLTYSRGLLTIASCLEKKGFRVKYLNYSDPIDRNNILPYAKESDFIGITTLTPTFDSVKNTCKAIKESGSLAPIILGGPHVTTRPRETLIENKYADFAIIGEAEERLPKLLSNINAIEIIPGIVYRENNDDVKITSNSIPPVIVSELPVPAYHLLNRQISEYAHNIRIDRGCPYKCQFCYERISKKEPFNTDHNLTQIISEIKLISNNQPKNTLVHFSDSILNINCEKTNQLLNEIRKLNSRLIFSFDTRVDLIKEQEVKEFFKSNFVYFRMGFESLHDNVLKLSKKDIDIEMQNEACKIIRNTNRNIAIHAYMLTGLPGTSLDSLTSDAKNIKKLISNDLVDVVGNKILVPYPGTPYYEDSKKYGISINTNEWKYYDRRSFPVYSLQNLTAEEIYFGYLLQEATLTYSYIKKLQGFEIEDVNKVTRGLDYVYANYADVH